MVRMSVRHGDDVDLAGAMESIFAQCHAGLAGAAPNAGLLLNAWGINHQFVIDEVRARYIGIELGGTSIGAGMSSILGFREDAVAIALLATDSIDMVDGLGRHLAADPLAAAHRAVAEATAKRSSNHGCGSSCEAYIQWMSTTRYHDEHISSGNCAIEPRPGSINHHGG